MNKNLVIMGIMALFFLVSAILGNADTGFPDSIAATYNADTGVLSASGTYSGAVCNDVKGVGFALFIDGADPTNPGTGSLDGVDTNTMHLVDPCAASGSWEDNIHNLGTAPEEVCVVIYDTHEDDIGNDDGHNDIPAGDNRNKDNSFERDNKNSDPKKEKDSYGELDCVVPEIIEDGNHEIPEFTTIGAGLALAGAGYYMYRKRSKK